MVFIERGRNTSATIKRSRAIVPAKERAIRAANVAADNRGRNIAVLEMKGLVTWVDYMVIVTSTSRRQGAAICDEIEAHFKDLGDAKLGSEGYQEGSWIILDFGDVVVHVFNDDKRNYYQLEHLWADAVPVEWKATTESDEPSSSRELVAATSVA